MTREDKELLLKDICTRLPYGVKCRMLKSDSQVCTLDSGLLDKVEILEPYLRPMSSMTEEEINEFILISDTMLWLGNNRSTCILSLSLEQMDWLNAHHFDYRKLIEKGLALEAPEGMYDLKK